MMGQWHNLPVGAAAPEWALVMFAFLGPLIILVVLWSLFWKGLALWHAARRGQHWWFLAMLIINTAGILEIVYLFGFAKLSVNQLFSRHAPHEH
jgi:methionyl-tRNA synthetase